MPDLKMTKNKHLTLDNREEIMECLDKGMTFKAIARRIGKDPTTVSKEVKKHMVVTKPGEGSRKLDNPLVDGRGCPRLLKAPFVCNPCEKKDTAVHFNSRGMSPR